MALCTACACRCQLLPLSGSLQITLLSHCSSRSSYCGLSRLPNFFLYYTRVESINYMFRTYTMHVIVQQRSDGLGLAEGKTKLPFDEGNGLGWGVNPL
jgi:hypothetical protein